MRQADPLYGYMLTLSVIEPARIQDIEKAASTVLPNSIFENLDHTQLRATHELTRELGFTIEVRKGVYALSQKARKIIRTGGLERELDNRRIFLMKSQRKDNL